jgi:hypothetical protein
MKKYLGNLGQNIGNLLHDLRNEQNLPQIWVWGRLNWMFILD